MGYAYYGRRPSMQGTSMPYRQRTATCGIDTDLSAVMADSDCQDMVLAMAYVPVQRWGVLYDVEVGFDRGTLFPDLDKPFTGGGCNCGL